MSETPAAAILEQLADALVYADRKGLIVTWNAAAEAMFGYPARTACGQSLDLIIPERLRPAHWAAYHRCLEAGRTRGAGVPTLTKALTAAGETIYVEMSFAVVSAEGEVRGAVAVARRAAKPGRRAANSAAGIPSK